MKTKLHISIILTGLILFIFMSINSKAQHSWVKYGDNPVLSVEPGSWYEWNAFFPVVIYEDDTYKMWFCGSNNLTYRHIGYAESPDGLDWDVFGAPVISGEAGTWALHKYPGSVIRVDDTLRMWYYGSTNSVDDGSIGYAWSVEEYVWNDMPEPVLEAGEFGDWDDKMVFHPSVCYDNSIYHMIYMGSDNSSETWELGYATSPDGINWEKSIHNPVIPLGPENSFYDDGIINGNPVMHNGAIHLFFTGFDGTSSYPPYYSFMRIGYAWSTNFTDWSIHPEPVLDVGGAGAWDETIVAGPSVLVKDDSLKMWYWGDHFDANWEIGYADGGLITNLFEHNNSIIDVFDIYPNPCSGAAHLKLVNSEQGLVIGEIFTINGIKIMEFLNDEIPQGTYELEIDVSDLPAGLYYCVLRTGSGIQTTKLIKL